MGGAEDIPIRPMMTIHQSPEADFEIMFHPDIEMKYAAMLNHPANNFRDRMAATFADQRNGTGDYIFKLRGLEADIVPRRSLEDRLADLMADNNN
jgi:hypothetical protein